MVKIVLATLFLMFSATASAELIISRVNTDFNNTWKSIKKTINAYNYKTAFIQKCDFALKERNYHSDKYRLFFYGNHEEMDSVMQKNPNLAAFLPIKLVVMQEGKYSLIIAESPIEYISLAEDSDSKLLLFKWDKDLRKILAQIKQEFDD